MSQDEIVQATLVRPGPVVTYSAEPPAKSRYGAVAVASVILPFLTGAAGVFLVIVGWNMPKFWFSWVMLGVMLLLGFVISVLPLRANAGQRKSIVRQCALTGLFLNIMAILFSLGCVAMAGGIMYLQQPEVQAAIAKAQAEEREQRAAEARAARQARLDQETPEQRQAREAQAAARRNQANEERRRKREREAEIRIQARREEYFRERAEVYPVWQQEVVRRFQAGPSRESLPRLPRDHDFDPSFVPMVQNQRLQFTEHEVTVTQVDRDLLAEEPIAVKDIRVQPIDFAEPLTPEQVHDRSRDWVQFAWNSEQSPGMIYVLEGRRIREIDTSNWRLKREVDIGGRGISIDWCRSGLVVSLERPELVIVLDPTTLQTLMAIPAHGVRQVVASPANDRLFLLGAEEIPCDLAVVNLETEKIEYLLGITAAVRLGRDSPVNFIVAGCSFLHLTADGQTLLGVGHASYRWSIAEDGELTFVESGKILKGYHQNTASPDGRLVIGGSHVYDITQSIASPLERTPSDVSPMDRTYLLTRIHSGAITNDGTTYGYRHGANLSILDPEGNPTADYAWLPQPERNNTGDTKRIHSLPDPRQLLVDTEQGWYVVWLPENLPSEP